MNAKKAKRARKLVKCYAAEENPRIDDANFDNPKYTDQHVWPDGTKTTYGTRTLDTRSGRKLYQTLKTLKKKKLL